MLLDEKSMIIIAKSIGFDDEGVREHIQTHFENILNMINAEILAYMAENDLEKLESIEEMLKVKNSYNKVKAMKTLLDQMKLTLTSYPDLQEKIDKQVKEIEHKVFFSFLEKGPTDGVEDLLAYMQEKLDMVTEYIKVREILKDRLGEDKVKEVLGT